MTKLCCRCGSDLCGRSRRYCAPCAALVKRARRAAATRKWLLAARPDSATCRAGCGGDRLRGKGQRYCADCAAIKRTASKRKQKLNYRKLHREQFLLEKRRWQAKRSRRPRLLTNTMLLRRSRRRGFFRRRARKRNASAMDLLHLWRWQRGRCGLTGVRLDRSAHLDHIVPRCNGGTDELSNLRWVCPAANLAKGGMADADFIALCGRVLNFRDTRAA